MREVDAQPKGSDPLTVVTDLPHARGLYSWRLEITPPPEDSKQSVADGNRGQTPSTPSTEAIPRLRNAFAVAANES